MFQSIFIYCVTIWFFFYLWNHSEILSKLRNFVYSRLNAVLAYLLQCSLCSTFWLTLVFFLMGFAPAFFICTAPIINLFIELSFRKLASKETTQTAVTETYSKDAFIITETSGDIQTK